MDHRDALDKTLREFKLSAKALAQDAGVLEQQISTFRNGKRDMTTKTFFQILEALPPEAQTYFFNQLNLRVAALEIDSMNPEQLANLLFKIGDKMRNTSVNSKALLEV